MTETPIKPPSNRIGKTAIIAVIIVAIVIIAAVVIVVEERKAVTPAPSKSVEFYNWYATEGKVALDHMASAFYNTTGIKVSSYVSPGAGGTNAIYAILALVEAGKPPATFQVHFGPAMVSYVEAAPNGINSFVNLGSAANSMGLTNNSFPGVIESGAYNGTLLSLPLEAQQGDQLYFNPNFLKEYKQPIPENISQLASVTENLSKMGVTAWIIPGGDGGWDQLQVWEDTFLAVGGNTMYDQLMYGSIPSSQLSTFYHDFNITNDYFSIFWNDSYPGEASMTWTQAIPLVTGGKVGFQANGDWYTNYAFDYLNVTDYPATSPYDNNITNSNYRNSNPVTIDGKNISLMNEDFPGTSEYYVTTSDSIAVPVGPNEANGIRFAEYASSYNGNLIFTKWKAATFYDNVTTDYYNTPAQYYGYQEAKTTPDNKWVYQLSDGGMFNGPLASIESSMTSFSESFSKTTSNSTYASANSVLDSQLLKTFKDEEQDWISANKLGLGYLGSPGHIFGGYLPSWANTSANRTASKYGLVKSGGATASNVESNSSVIVYTSPFSLLYLENMVIGGILPKIFIF